MGEILYEYWRNQDNIEIETSTFLKTKQERLMSEFYKYCDKIILGVINSKRYAYYRFAEVDDLMNEARMKIFESIQKRQWKEEKGNIFNFFTTVAARNLLSYTLNISKKKARNTNLDISKIPNDPRFIYSQDFDKGFNIDFVFSEMDEFFSNKKKFQKLLEVFKMYYQINMGEKFIKKNFIDFAKTYTFSRSFVNTFFNHCRKIKEVGLLMNEIAGKE